MNDRFGHNVKKTFPTMMDRLEGRVMLSGNVLASVVSGNLVVNGDASANSIVMEHGGLGKNQVRISGANGTTINGASAPVVFSGVRGLKLKLGSGNDSMKLDNLSFDRAVSIEGGSGNDKIEIEKHGSSTGPVS